MPVLFLNIIKVLFLALLMTGGLFGALLTLNVHRPVRRLGFLADISPTEMLAAVDQVLAGEHEREQRRLHQLVELAERFDDAPSLRPSDFVAAATTLRVEDGGAGFDVAAQRDHLDA